MVIVPNFDEQLELAKRTRPRKMTDNVSTKTAKKLPKAMAETTTAVSDGEEGTQLKDELRTIGKISLT